MFSNLAEVPERRARFTEERRFAALDQPLHSQGRLLWRRPDLLEKHTEAPEAETLRITGDAVEVALPGQPMRAFSLAAQPQLRGFVEALRAPLAGDLATLERLFDAELSGAPIAWQLRLVPRDARMRQAMAGMEILGALAEPREIRLRQPNGDAQTLLIEPLP
ncbi:outer membrane lipoprotein carrier protein LolA [Sediminicoccus sp. KRV36]|uniref:outer membrane lipoprotein carrier protein LolA n=1 Tax=Sediminicoccus sp. KRV36 TaxID=3133721 RepID=UPI00200CA413|nr:outer membrane lipoprotein carrier protein LolA [Sediminicoccus rosea]UPY37590.1 outer membrane lipoprotein carrier protein LolA [Sediminicoccus rosea]